MSYILGLRDLVILCCVAKNDPDILAEIRMHDENENGNFPGGIDKLCIPHLEELVRVCILIHFSNKVPYKDKAEALAINIAFCINTMRERGLSDHPILVSLIDLINLRFSEAATLIIKKQKLAHYEGEDGLSLLKPGVRQLGLDYLTHLQDKKFPTSSALKENRDYCIWQTEFNYTDDEIAACARIKYSDSDLAVIRTAFAKFHKVANETTRFQKWIGVDLTHAALVSPFGFYQLDNLTARTEKKASNSQDFAEFISMELKARAPQPTVNDLHKNFLSKNLETEDKAEQFIYRYIVLHVKRAIQPTFIETKFQLSKRAKEETMLRLTFCDELSNLAEPETATNSFATRVEPYKKKLYYRSASTAKGLEYRLDIARVIFAKWSEVQLRDFQQAVTTFISGLTTETGETRGDDPSCSFLEFLTFMNGLLMQGPTDAEPKILPEKLYLFLSDQIAYYTKALKKDQVTDIDAMLVEVKSNIDLVDLRQVLIDLDGMRTRAAESQRKQRKNNSYCSVPTTLRERDSVILELVSDVIIDEPPRSRSRASQSASTTPSETPPRPSSAVNGQGFFHSASENNLNGQHAAGQQRGKMTRSSNPGDDDLDRDDKIPVVFPAHSERSTAVSPASMAFPVSPVSVATLAAPVTTASTVTTVLALDAFDDGDDDEAADEAAVGAAASTSAESTRPSF